MPNPVKELLVKSYRTVLGHSPLVRGKAMEHTERVIWQRKLDTWKKENTCEILPTRPAIYDYLLRHHVEAGPLDFLEFGVFQGKSMRYWTEHHPESDARFVGFDTFSGLPESWEGYEQGHFNTEGNTPEIPDTRVQFVKGLFQDSLPGFLKGFERRGQIILHNDSDLYGSTLFVLLQLLPLMRPGDIVLFDELMYCTSEFRAWVNALEAYPLNYETLCATHDYCICAIKIK